MKVSFVIPVFNCLALTRECLRTLQATVPPGLVHEIILIDDGSTDDTRKWLVSLAPPVRVLLNPRNLGYATTNNLGVRSATGDRLVLLNNDLEFGRGWLEPMLDLHARLGARAGLTGNVQVNARTGAVDHAGMKIDSKGKPAHRTDFDVIEARFRDCRIVPAVTAACVLIDRSLWDQLGGFDEGFCNGGEDVDLCFRAAASGRVSAVALRSRIRHHVSASPGRKLKDEQNSFLLATKWREVLAAHALPSWAGDYLAREWARAPGEEGLGRAVSALLYVTGFRREAPAFVKDGVEAALAGEFTRWRHLMPGEPPASRRARAVHDTNH